jgi:oligo-1,6-glucosidase
VQWDDTENAGFTTGKPWFYVNQNYKQIKVAAQEADPNSLLNFYRKAISLRKWLAVVRKGDYQEFDRMNPHLYLYARTMKGQKILVACSFAEKPIRFRFPKGFEESSAKLILQNYEKAEGTVLQPYETRVYLWE